ncbi:MAG: mannonate dehydratase [Bryobacteraceae bacterium]|nr:mannonate dehydratase [Bryobacteraceae bacterium]MDW8378257.1 mannonate dehydratase [Bryobacterales bacterium]
MNRRKFLSRSSTAAGLFASAPAGLTAAANRVPVKMKLGCQSGPTDEKRLQFFKRHSVNHICGYPKSKDPNGPYTLEDLERLKDLCEKHKVSLEMIAPPFLASTHIDRTARPAIMLAESPARDRDIAEIQELIRNCARVGIPAIKYNMSILGVVRTQRTPGRGGSSYSTWRLREAKPPTPLTRAGRVDADRYWERITYFLERVIPVANEYKIRMACHPHDPGMPPEGYQGVDTVLGTPEGLKKFISIQESPYHGLNFCQGTVSEMLENPGREIFDIIRYFGNKKKIFNVHFRNIRGKRNDFQEVYPDEGDVDFVEAIKVYRDIGYEYMLMPDHVPHHPDDPHGDQAFAFAYGYIRALIQAADRLA